MATGPLDAPIDRRELLTYAGLGTGALILKDSWDGYGRERRELRVTYKAVDALRHNSNTRVIGRFRVGRGDPHVQVL